MLKTVMVCAICICLCGCAGPRNVVKAVIGNSTAELEAGRKDAYVKIFDNDYKACYANVLAIIKKMPSTTIYAQNGSMIAIFCVNPNTTPVGIFFTAIEPTRTQVEVSSPSRSMKEWVARNVFSATIL